MTGKAPAMILVLLATFLLLSVGCGGDTAQENPTPTGIEDVPLSKESAIEAVLDLAAMNPENKVDPSTAKAGLMTEQEAEDTIILRGGIEGRPGRALSDRLVWLVEVRGEFADPRGQGLTPRPTPRAGTLLWIVTMDGLTMSGATVYDSRQ
jgi:hypothetical protein